MKRISVVGAASESSRYQLRASPGELKRLHQLDPFRDDRWAEFVARSRCSSVFHSVPWLAALCETYGYEAVVYTDSRPGESLRNAAVFCRIDSWITGCRLVSLPFSDHCEPLVENGAALLEMMRLLKSSVGREIQYVEVRPQTHLTVSGFDTVGAFELHAIDLSRDLGEIFADFHRSHTKRSIRKAQRLGVQIETGRSAGLLDDFYALHAMTRRKHGVPTQPLR